MELAMPPATGPFSKTVTVNLSGCFDKAYAAETPAAPAPTIATRWVFMVVDEKELVCSKRRSTGVKEEKEYKFIDRML